MHDLSIILISIYYEHKMLCSNELIPNCFIDMFVNIYYEYNVECQLLYFFFSFARYCLMHFVEYF